MNISLTSALKRASKSVQPLVFETGVPSAPYAMSGTVFLVGHEGKPFVVTTRHSLRPDTPPPLCIFPSDGSRRVLPLKDVTYVPRSAIDEDFADLAVIEIDVGAAKNPDQRRALLINLEVAVVQGEEWTRASEFFVIGYPDYKAFIDYSDRVIQAERVAVSGRYLGQSPMPHVHQLSIQDAAQHPSFSGWSGSPVLAWLPMHKPRPQLALCGVAVSGSPQSGIMHFSDAGALLSLLDFAALGAPSATTSCVPTRSS